MWSGFDECDWILLELCLYDVVLWLSSANYELLWSIVGKFRKGDQGLDEG